MSLKITRSITQGPNNMNAERESMSNVYKQA